MASPVGAISLEWAEQELRCRYDKAIDMLVKIKELDKDTHSIPDQDLESYGIRKLANLDVDEDTVDFGPLFFRPFPVKSMNDFRQLVEEVCQAEQVGWAEPCIGGDTPIDEGDSDSLDVHLCPGPMYHARYRMSWADHLVTKILPDFYTLDADFEITHELCKRKHHRLISHDGHRWYSDTRHDFKYQLVYAFIPNERQEDYRWAPRIAGSVTQSYPPDGDDLLRSEVHSALHLLIHQLEHRIDDFHHTVPVLIYSFHQDKSARVTQFHFNGEELVVRQSRLLDMDSHEPTHDALVLVR